MQTEITLKVNNDTLQALRGLADMVEDGTSPGEFFAALYGEEADAVHQLVSSATQSLSR
ncbi:hypothetical protein [Alteromonas sp. S015]|uniref:hypothetical protein n=1 Tax=Alteromonas sp. S015 TaxID=3117401 RepID=UPI002FE33EFA